MWPCMLVVVPSVGWAHIVVAVCFCRVWDGLSASGLAVRIFRRRRVMM